MKRCVRRRLVTSMGMLRMYKYSTKPMIRVGMEVSTNLRMRQVMKMRGLTRTTPNLSTLTHYLVSSATTMTPSQRACSEPLTGIGWSGEVPTQLWYAPTFSFLFLPFALIFLICFFFTVCYVVHLLGQECGGLARLGSLSCRGLSFSEVGVVESSRDRVSELEVEVARLAA